MADGRERTYVSFRDGVWKSKQTEYTAPTKLTDKKGRLVARGWARHNLFDYERALISKRWRKEWEFYLVTNDKFMCLVSVVSTVVAGYINVAVLDINSGKFVESATDYFFGSRKLSDKGDAAGCFKLNVGEAVLEVVNTDLSREIHYKKGDIECKLQMDLFRQHENITTVIPFKNDPKKFFMTTKQNSMPCAGSFVCGGNEYVFTKENAFCCMDWGRICAPRRVVWYWGNGSAYVYDKDGGKHIFGFEITWGIGDESYATETCLFYDGIAHKIGAVDVEDFPKPDKYMEPWRFVSEDGRFEAVMTPIADSHTDTNIRPILRMHGHQVFGLWDINAILDDGTKLQIKDMHAFCEYVENKW